MSLRAVCGLPAKGTFYELPEVLDRVQFAHCWQVEQQDHIVGFAELAQFSRLVGRAIVHEYDNLPVIVIRIADVPEHRDQEVRKQLPRESRMEQFEGEYCVLIHGCQQHNPLVSESLPACIAVANSPPMHLFEIRRADGGLVDEDGPEAVAPEEKVQIQLYEVFPVAGCDWTTRNWPVLDFAVPEAEVFDAPVEGRQRDVLREGFEREGGSVVRAQRSVAKVRVSLCVLEKGIKKVAFGSISQDRFAELD